MYALRGEGQAYIERKFKMRLDAFQIELQMAEQELTQKRLAELCNVSARNVSIIMRRGTCEPKTAGKLAKALGVPVEKIIRKEG